MQHSIREKFIGPATPTRSPRSSNRHHQHHLYPLLCLPEIRDDSTFNFLQLNANGIGNKLTELGVVLKRNKVKVAVIQESKLSPKSKNPCIRTYFHSQIDNLLQTAIVTRVAIWSLPGRTFFKSWIGEFENFQHLHPSSQLLQ